MPIRNRSQYDSLTRQEFEHLDKKIKALENSIFLLPIGARIYWDGLTAPAGWVLCDGASYSRTVYNELFAVVGLTYGQGNGTTTFNVPNEGAQIIFTGIV